MKEAHTCRRAATVGVFDGVHLGHTHMLHTLAGIASARGLVPTVFTFARHPKNVVGGGFVPPAIATVATRCRHLIEGGARDVVVMNFDKTLAGMSALEFMTMLRRKYSVDVLLMGFNHRFGHDRLSHIDQYREVGLKCGIEVIEANEYTAGNAGVNLSSSLIRKLVAEGDIEKANIWLGHTFEISGTVAHGRSVGHTIGFPTANLQPYLPDQLLPKSGVYAGYAAVSGGVFPAMINVGKNPTVSSDGSTKIEAHLIGYDGCLYGCPISLGFVASLRQETKFETLEQLKIQLRKDMMLTAELMGDVRGRG